MTSIIARFASLGLGAGLVFAVAGQVEAQPGQLWKITSRQSDVLAETRVGSMYVRLSGKCSRGSSSVVVSLEGYRGNALRKVDQVEQPVTFVAEGQDGSRAEHRGAMFLFGDEVAMPQPLPASLVERLAQSDRLLIRNASGQPILTVPLAEAREFPARLARVCGTASPQTAGAQPTSGGKVSTTTGRVVASLPLRRGFYVENGTPCSQASNGTLQLVRRNAIGVAREICTFKRIEQTAPARYRVVQECRDLQGGPAETHVGLFDIPDENSFSVTRNDGQPYRARYCAQSSLPSPWRSNDIRDLIR